MCRSYLARRTSESVLWDPRRVQSVRRGPAASPLMTATYTYRANGDVNTITYGNGAQVAYTYDHHRLSSIDHLKPPATFLRLLRLAYTYDDRDLPMQITEYPESLVWVLNPSATTNFTYDHRGRLTQEVRVTYAALTDPTQNYNLDYEYDAGGNRTVKIDSFNHLRIEYHYDVDAEANPSVYKSRNNRLMWYETWNMANVQSPVLVSTTFYDYTYDGTYAADKIGKSDGNVTRIITEYPCNGGSQESMMSGSGTVGTTVVPDDGTLTGTESVQATPSPFEGEGWGEGSGEGGSGGGGSSAMMAPGGPGCDGCGTGHTRYRAIRLGYAENGQAVTFVHDEAWCWDHQSNPTGYTVTWAREFRYDGARARYMNRPLDSATLNPHPTLPTVWTDYDGDEPYRDFTVASVSPFAVTNGDEYQPGLWQKIAGASDYLHSDMLGTLRQTSGTTGTGGTPRVFTAFGERVSTNSDRFGFVGASGYQSTPVAQALDPSTAFPFLHVGHRYYDPSTGRFLQRDPIGIEAGPNVYTYVSSIPTLSVDPAGLFDTKQCCGYCSGKDVKCYKEDPKDRTHVTLCIANSNQCLSNCSNKASEIISNSSGDPGPPPYPNPNDPENWDPWAGVGTGGGCEGGGGGGASGAAAGTLFGLFAVRVRRRRHRSGHA